MVLYVLHDQQPIMPSLHQDPSSLPVLPILSDRIILAIRDPLLRLHKQGMPPWHQEIEAIITTLVDLGIKISVYPQAVEAQNKLHALAAAVPPSDTVYTTIDNQLIRDMRDIVHKRCDNGFLSLFLALVDGWLRSCEEYIRRSSGKRFANDISGFEDAYKELMVVATPNIANKAYRFDNLVYLFDSLGLTNS
jgi:hypothetical protein